MLVLNSHRLCLQNNPFYLLVFVPLLGIFLVTITAHIYLLFVFVWAIGDKTEGL